MLDAITIIGAPRLVLFPPGRVGICVYEVAQREFGGQQIIPVHPRTERQLPTLLGTIRWFQRKGQDRGRLLFERERLRDTYSIATSSLPC